MNSSLIGVLNNLYKSNKSPFYIKRVEISYGDEYNNEQGYEFHFTIFNKRYNVGHSYTTEDHEDWAQAECYEQNWCTCDDEECNKEDLLDLIVNYKSELREYKIDSIL